MFDTAHITGSGHAAASGPVNQSLHGALLRLAPSLSHLPAVWLAACAIVGMTGLLLAVSAARRGDEAWGFVSTAVTGLLICPVSWVHHWVIALPGLLLLATGSGRPAQRRALVSVALIAAAGSWSIKPVIAAHPVGEHLGMLGLLLGDLYVIAGLATLVTAAMIESSARRTHDWRRPMPGGAKRGDRTAAAVSAWEPEVALARRRRPDGDPL